MNTKQFLLIAICTLPIACSQTDLSNESGVLSVRNDAEVLSFDNVEDLNSYANALNGQETRSLERTPSGFISLWESLTRDFYSTLSSEEIASAEAEGLMYEPEDHIISDPIFAKIVNERREVVVKNETYRYTELGVVIYDTTVSSEKVDQISLEQYHSFSDKQEVLIESGIRFIRLMYSIPDVYDSFDTRSPSYETGATYDRLTLKNGKTITGDKLQYVKYGKGEGNATGFQKSISSIFGTSVVATNYFNSTHRMKLRTFCQDFIVYTSVGMTVRMQHKRAGVWWRRKAEEFRYGWTGVECHYTYNGPSFPSGVTFYNANTISHKTSYYEKPLVLFTVPLIDYQVTTQKIGDLVKQLLDKHKTTINNWLNGNPGSSNNPRSVFAADGAYSYSMIYPQYEESAAHDGREEVKWDFRLHFKVGITIGSSLSGSIEPVADPEKIEIRRGEIYAAVKYGGEWRACVISTY